MMFDLDLSFLLMLAQDLPFAPDEAAPRGPENGEAAPGARGDQGNLLTTFFWIMILMLGMMILFSILGQRREKKKREEMISAIKKHDKVQTIGGVIGSIVEIKPEHVVLKVDESSNTRITFARSAIQQVLKSSNSPAESEQA